MLHLLNSCSRRKSVILIGLGWLVLAGYSPARSAADSTRDIYEAQCGVCHGANGQGNRDLKAPALAGQGTAYIKRQLMSYKSGLRGAHPDDPAAKTMVAISVSLDDSIADLIVSYVAEMPPRDVPSVAGDVSRGEKYYHSYCSSCHGLQAQGNSMLNAPALNILDADYLSWQYQHFLNGIRGDKSKDKYGRQMAMMARALTDAEVVADVIAYITAQDAGLNTTQTKAP